MKFRVQVFTVGYMYIYIWDAQKGRGFWILLSQSLGFVSWIHICVCVCVHMCVCIYTHMCTHIEGFAHVNYCSIYSTSNRNQRWFSRFSMEIAFWYIKWKWKFMMYFTSQIFFYIYLWFLYMGENWKTVHISLLEGTKHHILPQSTIHTHSFCTSSCSHKHYHCQWPGFVGHRDLTIVAVVTPLNNFLGPAGDTVTAQKCSTKH